MRVVGAPSFSLLLAASSIAAPLAGQSVQGVVVDAGSYEPVALASVAVISVEGDSVAGTITDQTGFFRLPVDAGKEVVLQATALGYSRSRVGPFLMDGANDVQVVEIPLNPHPIEIEGLMVEGEDFALAKTGFYERMAERRGQFLTPEDIAASGARFTPELFQGLDHVMPEYAIPVWARWVTFMSAAERGNCRPRIWVDGVRLRWRGAGEGLDDVAPLEDVLGVEVYWGPFQAPIRYQGTTIDNSCGVVLIWTRGS